MNRRLKHVVMFTTFSAACAIVPCLPRLLASPTALQESSQLVLCVLPPLDELSASGQAGGGEVLIHGGPGEKGVGLVQ